MRQERAVFDNLYRKLALELEHTRRKVSEVIRDSTEAFEHRLENSPGYIVNSSQTSLIRAFLIHMPHNPNVLSSNLRSSTISYLNCVSNP